MMSDWNLPAAQAQAGAMDGEGPRGWRPYSEGLGSVICARLAQGESLTQICREADMPSRAGVLAWARRRPSFGARLAAARVEAREAVARNPYGQGRPAFCPQVARLVCERLAAGMSLRQACDLPGLPCENTVYVWVKKIPEFAKAYAWARTVQAHRRFDQVWEIAEAATPETAYAAKVKIEAARWLASRLAPTRYGNKPEAGENGEGGRPQMKVYIQKFGEDKDQAVLMDPQPGGR